MDFSSLKTWSGMEFIWVAIALASFALGIYSTFADGIAESYPMFIIVLIAVIMKIVRRQIRINSQNEN